MQHAHSHTHIHRSILRPSQLKSQLPGTVGDEGDGPGVVARRMMLCYLDRGGADETG